MNATIEQPEQVTVAALPELVVPDAERAISIVNRWLHTEVAMLIHVSRAKFIQASYCWHLPVQLSYPDTGPLGVIGDVYLHAATGQFIGLPDPDDLLKRAEALADARGILAEEDDDKGDEDKE